MIKRRDTQRLKVYRAGWIALPEDVIGNSLPVVQAYVDRVCNAAWFRRRWGTKKITVKFKKGTGGYNPAYSNVIVVGQNATGRLGRAPGATKATVLHEMAHVLTGHCNGAWHGPEFARILLELVGFEFGPVTSENLKAAYKTQRVTVGKSLTLKPADATPAPRPKLKAWRVVIGDQSFQIEGANLLAAVRHISNMATLTTATDIRIYKSRRVSK